MSKRKQTRAKKPMAVRDPRDGIAFCLTGADRETETAVHYLGKVYKRSEFGGGYAGFTKGRQMALCKFGVATGLSVEERRMHIHRMQLECEMMLDNLKCSIKSSANMASNLSLKLSQLGDLSDGYSVLLHKWLQHLDILRNMLNSADLKIEPSRQLTELSQFKWNRIMMTPGDTWVEDGEEEFYLAPYKTITMVHNGHVVAVRDMPPAHRKVIARLDALMNKKRAEGLTARDKTEAKGLKNELRSETLNCQLSYEWKGLEC